MASGQKISQYGNDTSPVTTDYVLGNKASGPTTSTFKLSDLIALFFTNANIPAATQIIDRTKNPYKFRAYRNGAATSTNGNVLVTFDTVTYDTGSNYSVSTGKFTAPVAGFYNFYSLISASGTPAVAWQTFIYKNGSPITNGINGSAASNVTSNVFDRVQLAANDFIQIFIGSGGSTTIVATSVASYVVGILDSAT